MENKENNPTLSSLSLPNEQISYDYDENALIDDDDLDSAISGENNNQNRRERLNRILSEGSLAQLLLSKRRKIIHFFCRKVLIVSFVPTFLYSIFWITVMSTITKNIEKKICESFFQSRNYILIVNYVVLIKGLIILFIPILCCGSEKGINDCSYSCVGIKSFTSFIISYKFSRYLERELHGKNAKSNNDINNIEGNYLKENYFSLDICGNLNFWIEMFLKSEVYYIRWIISAVLIGLGFLALVISKECWKTRGYAI